MDAKTLSAEDRAEVFKEYAFSLNPHAVRSSSYDTGVSHWKIAYTSEKGHKVTGSLRYCAQPRNPDGDDESYPMQNSGYYGRRAHSICEKEVMGYETLIKIAEQQQMPDLVQTLNKGRAKVYDPNEQRKR